MRHSTTTCLTMPTITFNNINANGIKTPTTPNTPTAPTNPLGGVEFSQSAGAKRFADLVNKRRLVSKAVSAFQARRQTYRVKNEQKAVKVLGVVFIVFVIAWVPFAIANIMSAVCELTGRCFIPPSWLTALTWFGYISSSINPLIYNAINERFRFAFKQILACRWHTLRKRQLAQAHSANTKLVAAKMTAHDMALMSQQAAGNNKLQQLGANRHRLSALRDSNAHGGSQDLPELAACRRLLLTSNTK